MAKWKDNQKKIFATFKFQIYFYCLRSEDLFEKYCVSKGVSQLRLWYGNNLIMISKHFHLFKQIIPLLKLTCIKIIYYLEVLFFKIQIFNGSLIFTCINIYKWTQPNNFKKSNVMAFQINIGQGRILKGPF